MDSQTSNETGNSLSSFISFIWKSNIRKRFLPLPSSSNEMNSLIMINPIVKKFLNDIRTYLLRNLHITQKHLQFWESRAKRSDAGKANFLIFERGPVCFIHETFCLLRGHESYGSFKKQLSQSASIYIKERVSLFKTLSRSLTTFLAQFYLEVHEFEEASVRDPNQNLPSFLGKMNGFFKEFEESVQHLQSDSSSDGTYSFPSQIERLPASNWTESEIMDAIKDGYEILDKLDSYISILVTKYRRPRKIAQRWIRYSGGAVGLSICSMWLLQCSRVMESPNLKNVIKQAKDSTTLFYTEIVQQPLYSIRDVYVGAYKKRHGETMTQKELQLGFNSLQRMLLELCADIEGKKFSEDSTLEMLEILMTRYEKDLKYPIKNVVHGELGRVLLILVLKLKLEAETTMHQVKQILRANELNFALLGALPAFTLFLLVTWVVRSWFKQERRGSTPQRQRSHLLVEIDDLIRDWHDYKGQRKEKDALRTYGLLLYRLDCLCHSVMLPGDASEEWSWLQKCIIKLANPETSIEDKERAMSSLKLLLS